MLAGINKNFAQEVGLPREILGHTTRRCWMEAGAEGWKKAVKGALPTARNPRKKGSALNTCPGNTKTSYISIGQFSLFPPCTLILKGPEAAPINLREKK